MQFAESKPSVQQPITKYVETDEQQKQRFQIELEFVQCLANPSYLNHLAQHGYFKDPNFVNYLKYLQYWKQPEYAKFLRYPMCLHFLDLLQYEHFRREIMNSNCAKFIEDQQLLHWQHYIRKRTRLLQQASSTSGQHGQQSNSDRISTGSASSRNIALQEGSGRDVTGHK